VTSRSRPAWRRCRGGPACAASLSATVHTAQWASYLVVPVAHSAPAADRLPWHCLAEWPSRLDRPSNPTCRSAAGELSPGQSAVPCCQCEAGIPLDCPWQRCAAHRCTCLSTLACRVRHWLGPCSLTSERSGRRPSWLVRDAAVRCHSVRDTCSTLAPSPADAARSAGRAKSHALPQRAADRRTQRVRTRVHTVLSPAPADPYIRYSRLRMRVRKVYSHITRFLRIRYRCP
jgi:hypothetical protein